MYIYVYIYIWLIFYKRGLKFEKNCETDITVEDILNVIGTDNRREKLYKLMEFITKDRLKELKEILRERCKSKCIIPLRRNISKNIKNYIYLTMINCQKKVVTC